MQLKNLSNYFDGFVLTLISILIIGILVPVPASWTNFLTQLGTWAVTILFLVYGMRLRTSEVWAGLTNYRLQGSVFICTFLLFPIAGLALSTAATPLLGATFALGLLYLSLLPSTVQSSVSFTSIAGGNVAGAVCAATISNISGMLLTPALVWLFIGASSGIDASSVVDVLLKLLLPFCVGQILQPWVGDWVRGRKFLTRAVDRGTILIVVAASITGATARGLWASVSIREVFWLLVFSLLLLAATFLFTWFLGARLGLNWGDRITLLMCGSKKSLATGLPMAAIIFPPAIVAAVTIPVIIFHQLQLMVAAVISRRLAVARHVGEESTW